LYIPFNLRKTGYQTYINGISRDYKSVRMRRFLCFFFPLFFLIYFLAARLQMSRKI